MNQFVEDLLKRGDAKLVPWDNRYAISKTGQLFSKCKKGRPKKDMCTVESKWKAVKIFVPTGKKYARCAFGKHNYRHLHSVLTETFLGPKPDCAVVRHIDGNSLNNNLDNLAYGSYQENSSDMVIHGNSLRGTRHPQAKIKEWDVRLIREMWSSGYGQKSISTKLKISYATINNIVNGRAWRWLDA